MCLCECMYKSACVCVPLLHAVDISAQYGGKTRALLTQERVLLGPVHYILYYMTKLKSVIEGCFWVYIMTPCHCSLQGQSSHRSCPLWRLKWLCLCLIWGGFPLQLPPWGRGICFTHSSGDSFFWFFWLCTSTLH